MLIKNLECSSRFEGFGMVILEAQANEIPVVSFDCPYGPSELIKNNETGILIENGNIEKLTEEIRKRQPRKRAIKTKTKNRLNQKRKNLNKPIICKKR